MHCPFCHHDETKVIDSRLSEEGLQVRRRRECIVCNERFTTYESAELSLPRIIKSDNSREAFDQQKLRRGIQKSLEKRPVSTEQIESMIQHIIRHLLTHAEREVTSQQLGEWVMDELKLLDEVAYVRFASVYRSFQDISEFREEIQRLEARTQRGRTHDNN